MRLRTTYYKILLGIGLNLFLVPTCHADKLEVVVAQVVANNPSILAQSAHRYAQDNKLRQTLSGYFPTVDVTASYGRDYNRNFFTRLESPSNGGDLTLTKREAGFRIKQMLFDGFALRSEAEADSAKVKSSSFHVLQRLEQVVLDVTAAYIDTIMLRSIYMHAKENLANHQKVVENLGNGSFKKAQDGDLDLAKSRVSLVQTQMLGLQRDIRDSQADYIRVVGAKPGVMFRPDAPESKLPNSEESAVAVAIKNNPLVHIANAEISGARADKRGSKANYFPTLDLEISGSNNKNVDGYNQSTRNLSAMLQMKYNVFRGGKDVAGERKTAWLLEEKKEELKESMRYVEQNMRHAWSAYVSYKGQLAHLKSRVDALSKTREAYYSEVLNGDRAILEYLDAEDELYRAKAEYVAAQYKELLSRFMILQAMGKIKDHFNIATPASVSYCPKQWVNGF